MSHWIAGDLEPDLELTIDQAATAESLTLASAIQMRWRRPDGTQSLVTLTAIDLPNRRVKYVWQAGDTDMVGTHFGRVVITRSNGERETFPKDGSWFYWTISAS
jgi:hypothetical protein